MTPREFCFWLTGLLENSSKTLSREDFAKLQTKLASVSEVGWTMPVEAAPIKTTERPKDVEVKRDAAIDEAIEAVETTPSGTVVKKPSLTARNGATSAATPF